MLGDPISLFDDPEEKSTNQPDYEATLEEIEPEEAKDRFFLGRLKCAFHRGRCLPLCVSLLKTILTLFKTVRF